MSVLVLASSSAVRARLLAAAGVETVIDPAAIDERAIKDKSRAAEHDATDCAMLLAKAKAIWGLPLLPLLAFLRDEGAFAA